MEVFVAVFSFVLWMLFSKGTVSWVEFALLEAGLTLRSCVIAIKYAYLPNEEI